MRRLYLFTTGIFWLFVAAFWAASLWLPPTVQPQAIAAEKVYSTADLARHATPINCWMAIRGNVYDVSTYLPDHPSRPELVLPWCGKEATEAYDTKSKGRPHKATTDDLLATFRIGRLAVDTP